MCPFSVFSASEKGSRKIPAAEKRRVSAQTQKADRKYIEQIFSEKSREKTAVPRFALTARPAASVNADRTKTTAAMTGEKGMKLRKKRIKITLSALMMFFLILSARASRMIKSAQMRLFRPGGQKKAVRAERMK